MNNLILILIFGISICFASCKKDGFNNTVPTSALNVINADPDAPSMNVNFTTDPSPYYLYQRQIRYGSSYEWGVPPGDSPIVIVSSSDTNNFIYKGNIQFAPQAIYSLYVLSGSSAGQGNVLLMQDTIPVRNDSTAGIRFINLTSDGTTVTVNLYNNPVSQIEFGPLSFEQITQFKGYPPTAEAFSGLLAFEAHDASNGNLLNYGFWSYQMFRNATMVVSGSANNGYTVIIVNNY